QGFGCRILEHDSRPAAAADYVPLDDLLQRSDLGTLHTPLTADTYHLLNRQRLKRMQRGAFIVNTGRVELLDLLDHGDRLADDRFTHEPSADDLVLGRVDDRPCESQRTVEDIRELLVVMTMHRYLAAL
ncbi:hypothetical protein B4Q13_21680, partial [Lacticaseibacillus rhamnosus]